MLGDIEDVTREIATALSAQAFADLLAVIDTEKNASVETKVFTPRPAEVWEGEKATPLDYPSCQIVATETDFSQEQQPSLQDGTHRLQIIWLMVGDDEIRIGAQLKRLVLATRATLWNTVFEGRVNAAPTRIVREDYSDLAVTADSAFLKGARVFVEVPTLVQ